MYMYASIISMRVRGRGGGTENSLGGGAGERVKGPRAKMKNWGPRFRRSWSGGMLPQEIFLQIRCSEIASEAILRQAES